MTKLFLPIAQIPSLNYSPFEHHGHHFQSQQQTQPSGVQPHIPTQQDSHSPSSQQRQQRQLQQQQLHHHHQHEQQQQIGSQYYSVPFSLNGPIHAPVYPEVPRHYSLPVNVIPAQNGAHPIQGVYPHPLQGQTRRRPRSKRYTNLQCQRCGITETPEWRKGPNGARTLCNACGLFHAKVLKRDGAEAAALAVVNTEVKKRRRRQRKYKPNEPMTIQVPVPIALPIPMGMAPVPVQAQATTQAYC
ncbi:GAT3 [Cyberlindnera jadinii]|uniref:GAT3 protein n=1 Tax=Cyberlindnera jadinii (strain ATCC 18201 / CBS 1600 / BCRC 20928 / JCM 3617 / NBRC 0987 / NRRL Y-1542) TaxID=983966 RepID=A0A0H5CAL0_CYBJN|nr:GAT3 [Cyberlindnera jadinii]